MAKEKQSDEKRKEKETGIDSELGILFVHGIGDQKKGDTLIGGAEPLYGWFKLWLEGAKKNKKLQIDNVDLALSNAILTEDAKEPSHCKLDISYRENQKQTQKSSCLLAESHWADAFPIPRYGEFVNWLIGLTPWTLTSQFALRFHEAVTEDSKHLINYPRIMINFLLSLLGFLAAVITQIVFVVLNMVALIPIPVFRTFLMKLQLRLTNYIGDSYIFLKHPLQANAIVFRVARDIQWLSKHCSKIAIVAHSQGGAVAYHALQYIKRTGNFLKNKELLLITYGSALNKLHDIECAQRDKKLLIFGFFVMLFIDLSIVSVVFWLILYFVTGGLLIAKVPWDQMTFLCVLVCATAAIAFWTAFKLFSWRKDLIPNLTNGLSFFKWIDRYATADLVPAGRLVEKGTEPAQFDSKAVNNQHNIITDHVTYWKNIEQFVTTTAIKLGEKMGFNSLDMGHNLQMKAECRRRRIVWLVWARSVVTISGLWTVYHSATLLRSLGRHLIGFLNLADNRTLKIIESFGLLFRITKLQNPIIGILAIAIPFIALYFLVAASGRIWQGINTNRFLNHKEYKRGGIPFALVSAFGFILPILGIVFIPRMNVLQIFNMCASDILAFSGILGLVILAAFAFALLMTSMFRNLLFPRAGKKTKTEEAPANTRKSFMIAFVIFTFFSPLLGTLFNAFGKAILGGIVVTLLTLSAVCTGWNAMERICKKDRVYFALSIILVAFYVLSWFFANLFAIIVT